MLHRATSLTFEVFRQIRRHENVCRLAPAVSLQVLPASGRLQVLEVKLSVLVRQRRYDDDPTRSRLFQLLEQQVRQIKVTCTEQVC